MYETALRQGLAALNLACDEEKISILVSYIRELEEWNSRFNLIRASGQEIVYKHILDSLAALPVICRYLDPSAPDAGLRRLADVGSGAGLPGIPLAVFLPAVPIYLIERLPKKAAFLTHLSQTLRLPQVKVLNCDLRETREKFELITFRAFAPLGRAVPQLLKHLTPYGVMVAYKATEAKVRAELAEIKEFPVNAETIKLTVPGLAASRCVICLQRTG